MQTDKDRIHDFFSNRHHMFYSRYVTLNVSPASGKSAKIPSPFRNETVGSFQIDFVGKWAGRWHDYGSGEDGDIIDFYMRVESTTNFKDAVEGIIRDFNIPTDPKPVTTGVVAMANAVAGSQAEQYKDYPLSWLEPYEAGLWDNKGGSLDYLTGRGLSLDTIKHFRLGYEESAYNPASKSNIPCIIIPHIVTGRVALVKKRGFPEKAYLREGGMRSVLFNQDSLDDEKLGDVVYICEGEFDAMVMWQCGYERVVSGTTGAGSFQTDWIEKTGKFESVVIAYDADQSGQDGKADLILRLGEDRAKVMKIPKQHGDINNLLISEGKIGVMKIAASAQAIPLKNVDSFANALTTLSERLADGGGIDDDGMPWPWENCTEKFGLIMPGKVIGLSGKAGLGKTTLGIQVATHLASEEMVPCNVCCLEMTPEDLSLFPVQSSLRIERDQITAQIINANIDTYAQWPLFFQFHDGVVGIDEVLEVFTQSYKRFGCKFFVLDNLRILVRASEDELREQGRVTLKLRRWTIRYNTSVLLLTHPRKLEEGKIESLGDISGSAAAGNDFDVSIAMWRKNLQARSEEELMKESGEDGLFHPITCLISTKGRFGGGGRTWLFNEGKHRMFRRVREDDIWPEVDAPTGRR